MWEHVCVLENVAYAQLVYGALRSDIDPIVVHYEYELWEYGDLRMRRRDKRAVSMEDRNRVLAYALGYIRALRETSDG